MQGLTSIVTVFDAFLRVYARNPAVLLQLERVGFLAQYESLVSTSGAETHMLEDFVVGVVDLRDVKFKVGVLCLCVSVCLCLCVCTLIH